MHDLDRAVAFYRDVLGLRFLFQAPPGLAFFECGGVRLMLSLPGGARARATTAPCIYYVVDDIRGRLGRRHGAGRDAATAGRPSRT